MPKFSQLTPALNLLPVYVKKAKAIGEEVKYVHHTVIDAVPEFKMAGEVNGGCASSKVVVAVKWGEQYYPLHCSPAGKGELDKFYIEVD